ncbi:aspartate/glutamate racemase family protein [Mariniluteicoccus endophyticus]
MSILGFLHTSPVHVAPFDALVHEHWPLVATVHLSEPGLLEQARVAGAHAASDGVVAALDRLREAGADLVCCTCSSIGAEAEAVGGPDVFRVDRPMARRAVETGRAIAVIAAVTSTLTPTEALLGEEARSAGRDAHIELVEAPGAWQLFEEGDQPAYHRAIAEAARAADVVVLAQTSMAAAQTCSTT